VAAIRWPRTPAGQHRRGVPGVIGAADRDGGRHREPPARLAPPARRTSGLACWRSPPVAPTPPLNAEDPGNAESWCGRHPTDLPHCTKLPH